MIVRFLNFLLVPFYVNVLATTAEYGVSASVYAWMAFLNVIYPLGLEGAFFRYASRGENEIADENNEKRFGIVIHQILNGGGQILKTALG